MDEVEPPSPTSLALQSLNMSRDDLARHTYQMRSFLQTSAASLHVLAANEPATHVPPPTTVHPSIATATNDTRPSLDMVLEATQKKRKDSRRDRKQGDATSPRSSTQSIRNTSSRPSSVCSSFQVCSISLPFFSLDSLQQQSRSQDVFYSRPASTAPSFRRSASFSSQTSITIKRDEDEEESRVPALTPIKQQRPLNAIPPQIVIPSSSSPTYEGTASSPVDPRTPYRPPIHLMQGSNGRAVKGRLPANSVSSPAPVSSPNGELGYPFTLPSGPRLTSKPHYSYAALIGQALMSSPKGRLSLNQIYTWISLAYPYFKRGESGWQNSIRHNLSLNGCFVKIKRDDGEKGKGSWWAIREGDEMCFSGGGFQRQGRANGRKRKGKEETLEDPPTAGYPESEPEDDGASPKKKRKAALAKSASSPTQQGNVLFAYPPPPSNTAGPSFSKSRSKSAKGPVYAPPGGADPNAKITTFNGVNVHGHPLAHLLEAAALNPAFQATLANGAQYDTLSSPKGPRLRTLQASDLSSSPRDHHGMPYEHEEDVHEPEEAQQDIGDGSVRHPSLLQLVQLHRAASVHSFASTNSLMNDPADEDDDNSEHDQIPVLEPPHMTQSMASALGQPFEMDTTRSSSPNSSPLSAAPTSLASSSSSSSASLSLQPGFTFVPPAKKSKRSSAEGVYIKEEPYEDEDGFTLPRAKLSNVYHDEVMSFHYYIMSCANRLTVGSPLNVATTHKWHVFIISHFQLPHKIRKCCSLQISFSSKQCIGPTNCILLACPFHRRCDRLALTCLGV